MTFLIALLIVKANTIQFTSCCEAFSFPSYSIHSFQVDMRVVVNRVHTDKDLPTSGQLLANGFGDACKNLENFMSE